MCRKGGCGKTRDTRQDWWKVERDRKKRAKIGAVKIQAFSYSQNNANNANNTSFVRARLLLLSFSESCGSVFPVPPRTISWWAALAPGKGRPRNQPPPPRKRVEEGWPTNRRSREREGICNKMCRNSEVGGWAYAGHPCTHLGTVALAALARCPGPVRGWTMTRHALDIR